MKQIHAKLVQEQRASLSEMLEGGMHKSAMIGVFLAVLELARHHSVRTQQDELHGEIWLVPDKDFSPDADFSSADSYGGRVINESDLPSKPR
jgi:segregation and condensation protein A